MTITQESPDRTVARTLHDVLADRARDSPNEVAYVHLVDGEDTTERLTYAQLHRDARTRAAGLVARGLTGGRAVLAHDTGLDFVRDLFACFLAGVTPVPVPVPNRRHGVVRLHRIATDAQTAVLLTTAPVAAQLHTSYPDMPELAAMNLIDSATLTGSLGRLPGEESDVDDLALLQYTSGSTGDPKGVKVTHRNFWHNTADIMAQWPIPDHGAISSWLPLFHDLGLLLGAILPVRAGVPAHLMSPSAFIRRPMRWLETVSRHRITHIAAPNFAFQLCLDAVARSGVPADLDLSSLLAALNGAEPVRWATIARFVEVFASAGFRPTAPAPAYGLAEATLHVTGTRHTLPAQAISVSTDAPPGHVVPVPAGTERSTRVVSCGTPVPGTVVRIVDPATSEALRPRRIGEIWVHGPGVAQGYWQRPQETVETFGATIADEPGHTYLRTGDLGFLHDGELYVCGRRKDVLIRNGRNHYPNDIERVAEQAHPLLRASSSAAFAVDRDGREEFVLVVEADGRLLRAADPDEVTMLVVAAVERDLRVVLDDVVLIQRGTLAKTTSGKVRRQTMRQRYLDGTLTRIARAGAGA